MNSEEQQKGTHFLDAALNQEEETEAVLRPLTFSDFTGQRKTKERLEIIVGAARERGDVLNHVLISGPPGLGKTTLAYVLGSELNTQVRPTSGPVVEKPGDLAGMLTNLEEGNILFIDEIHRIPKTVEEYLYSAMEDFKIDIMLDQGPQRPKRPTEYSTLYTDWSDYPARTSYCTAAQPLYPSDAPRLLCP